MANDRSMKLLYSLNVTFVIILLSASSCTYYNEETLYPDLFSCDTTNITFSGTITKILAGNCFSCHSDSQAPQNGNNIHLESYADVAAMADVISGAIKHLPSHSPMPKNGRKLNTCLIRQFDKWKEQGSPDN